MSNIIFVNENCCDNQDSAGSSCSLNDSKYVAHGICIKEKDLNQHCHKNACGDTL